MNIGVNNLDRGDLHHKVGDHLMTISRQLDPKSPI